MNPGVVLNSNRTSEYHIRHVFNHLEKIAYISHPIQSHYSIGMDYNPWIMDYGMDYGMDYNPYL